MLTASDLFSSSFYLAANPDVAAAVAAGAFTNALEHFNLYGKFEGRDPSALFEIAYYRERNTDVAGAVESGATSEFDHFLQYGQVERRTPLALFDTDFYLRQNPDVAAAVQTGAITAFEHFVKFGQLEGRDPTTVFDTSYYLERNPDVAAAVRNGTFKSAIEHYILFGLAEGRPSTPPDSQDDLSGARDLGVLGAAVSLSDFVGNSNREDIYRFVLNTPSNFSLSVGGLSADVDVELIEDLSGNGIIEFDDIFASSKESGAASEAIDFEGLPAGTYFVRVSQFEGDTNYNLSLSPL